jgi:hypothetical protein
MPLTGCAECDLGPESGWEIEMTGPGLPGPAHSNGRAADPSDVADRLTRNGDVIDSP